MKHKKPIITNINNRINRTLDLRKRSIEYKNKKNNSE